MNTETHTVAGHSFDLPQLATENIQSAPSLAFMGAAAELDDFGKAARKIADDDLLSEAGKAAKAAPLAARTWQKVIDARASLDTFAATIDQREAALYAVPSLDDGASAVAIEDREARDWWRSLPAEGRLKMLSGLQTVGDDGEATFTRYSRLWVSLLRSPIPLPDHELAVVRDVWNSLRRIEKPSEYESILNDRNVLTWAMRGLAHLQGIASQATGWTLDQVADLVAGDDAREKVAAKMGVTHHQIHMAQIRKSR
ncbi:MAG: hypothetical protein EPN31_12145 [Castellaniella sp.]|uniref:hypothetical protein n=1 Tax=Castellaniella sp. TaxID=1955812 RepID=UPI00120CCD3B|nr:hypothetical protein [Castellaniella sp.]TAN27278.1 MAG: hypothetical protein EPN31_12145 [Castellaniella sp.]